MFDRETLRTLGRVERPKLMGGTKLVAVGVPEPSVLVPRVPLHHSVPGPSTRLTASLERGRLLAMGRRKTLLKLAGCVGDVDGDGAIGGPEPNNGDNL